MSQVESYLKIKMLSSLVKVFPTEEPIETGFIKHIAKNEQLNFQIAIYNQSKSLMGFMKVKVKGDLANSVALRNVDLVPMTMFALAEDMGDDYYLSEKAGLYPDVLSPIDCLGVTIPFKQWRSIFVSVQDLKGLPVGEHQLTFEIYNEKDEKLDEISYSFEVVDFELREKDLVVTNWMHYDCIAQKHGIELFNDEFYEIFETYLDYYQSAGNNTILVPLFTPALDTQIGEERLTAQLVKVSYINDKYSFDFKELEKFINFVMEKGIKYLELSHLFTQWGGEHSPKIIATTIEGKKRIFGWETDAHGKEYTRFLTEFLPELKKELIRLGVDKKCFIHLTDEPSKENIESYKKSYEIVKPLVGDIPIMDALSDYSFYELGLVDIPTAITNSYDDQFSKHGVNNLFVYYCCIPSDKYYSNRFISMPPLRTRILGFQLYASGVKGFLHWGFNFFQSKLSLREIDPYTTTDAYGFFPSGDAFIVYPTKKGLKGSLRLEYLREAFQDYQVLKELESLIGRESVLNYLSEWGLKGFYQYPHCDKSFVEFREKLYEEIKNLKK